MATMSAESSVEQRAPSPIDQAPAHVAHESPLRPRPTRYAYHHANSDITVHELEEFFSYVEVSPVVTDCKLAWERVNFDWFTATDSARHAIIVTTFDLLEHPDMHVRHDAARRLSYIALGKTLLPVWIRDRRHLFTMNLFHRHPSPYFTGYRPFYRITFMHHFQKLRSPEGLWCPTCFVYSAEKCRSTLVIFEVCH